MDGNIPQTPEKNAHPNKFGNYKTTKPKKIIHRIFPSKKIAANPGVVVEQTPSLDKGGHFYWKICLQHGHCRRHLRSVRGAVCCCTHSPHPVRCGQNNCGVGWPSGARVRGDGRGARMRPSLIGGQGHGAMWRLWQLTPAPPPPQNGAQGCAGCWWGRRGHNETRALPTPPPVEALEEMGKDQGDAETKGKEATSAAKKIKKKSVLRADKEKCP